MIRSDLLNLWPSKLLASNRHISVAFLSRRVRDIEAEMRDRFRQWQAEREKRVESLEEQVTTLKERLQQAAVKFREMREELDAMKKKQEEADERLKTLQGGA